MVGIGRHNSAANVPTSPQWALRQAPPGPLHSLVSRPTRRRFRLRCASSPSLPCACGSRAGCRRAERLAATAVGAGYGVVSGGALGIDAAAHRGALAEGGVTFAVLGCGVDVVYPDRHGPLFGEVERSGGLLSEYAPGTP